MTIAKLNGKLVKNDNFKTYTEQCEWLNRWRWRLLGMPERQWTCRRSDNYASPRNFPPEKTKIKEKKKNKIENKLENSLKRVFWVKTQKLTHGQWWSNRDTQLSQRLQWDARGGRKILHVKQYFSLTIWPRTRTSLVRGGGR